MMFKFAMSHFFFICSPLSLPCFFSSSCFNLLLHCLHLPGFGSFHVLTCPSLYALQGESPSICLLAFFVLTLWVPLTQILSRSYPSMSALSALSKMWVSHAYLDSFYTLTCLFIQCSPGSKYQLLTQILSHLLTSLYLTVMTMVGVLFILWLPLYALQVSAPPCSASFHVLTCLIIMTMTLMAITPTQHQWQQHQHQW